MSEREVLELDVLFVGAGPASLAGAIHLQNLLKETGNEASIAIIEKAGEIGAHSLSGAIVDPRTLQELFPDFDQQNIPFESEVTEEHLYYITKTKKFSFPFYQSRDHNLTLYDFPFSPHGVCSVATAETNCQQILGNVSEYNKKYQSNDVP